ncbi:MAG: di-trans,poly-cis-decaprenylcistransferase [Planctomycetes bacterium]|nr:di-trans,poly-cis-decaprenylcistransferase [Planctomycetota bacterium]
MSPTTAKPATAISGTRPNPLVPRHIAIIMDGNGRWAEARGLVRELGHKAGSKTVREITESCAKRGIQALTLYSFSSENWKRPQAEIAALMQLLREHLKGELPTMLTNNIRFRRIGRREGLHADVLALLDDTEKATAHCGGLTLCLALNYGARAELADACRVLAQKAKDGAITVDSISESVISQHLFTAGLPDPDLLIRTAGEMRVSNFLLWQISYAEFHVTQTLWPDFGEKDLEIALQDFANRRRTYGGLTSDVAESAPAG